MDIIDILLIFILGYFIGKTHAYYKLASMLREVAAEAGIDLEKELNLKPKKEVEEIYKLQVDAMNDVLYLYNRDTNDFICQGKTIEELALSCKEHKKILLASVIYGEQVYMFVNGVSKEYVE